MLGIFDFMNSKNIIAIFAITILFIPVAISPINEKFLKKIDLENGKNKIISSDDGTNYWALIVAVGIYANNPDMDRPSMLRAADNLYHTLLVTPWWNNSHIKVIKGKNATIPNIMAGFAWLAKNVKEDDICLVYLTTHGFPILFDLPPRDEKDGMDEALATYRGFLPFSNPWSWEPLANPFAIITDDEINFMLNRINAKGIAVIVDSCHSGGFNDNWSYTKGYNFAYEIGNDLKGHNRIVLTSVREDEISYGSFFSDSIIEGLEGYADSNKDGFCSVEEAFYYAKSIITNETSMHPQIFDDYPGELILTKVEMPPSIPKISGKEVGKTNNSYTYHVISYDPEVDRIKYEIDWGDSMQQTIYFESGEMVSIQHEWKREGTYNVGIRAIDERGAASQWNYSMVITMADKHEVDQRQVKQSYAYLLNDTRWLAQSFIPKLNRLEKIELCLICWKEGYDVTIEIRDSLNGNKLAEISKEIIPTHDWKIQWVSFNINANLVKEKEYYIVCHSNSGWGVAWITSSYDAYENGSFYKSNDSGKTWISIPIDACFVTYG